MTRSYVAIDADEVITMASKRLMEIQELRKHKWYRYAEKQVNIRNQRWYRKLFRMQPVTPEDILREECNKQDWDSQYWRIFQWQYDSIERLANQLVAAALVAKKSSDSPMLISVEDIDNL